MREFEGRRAYGCGSGEPPLGGDGVSVFSGVALHKVVDRRSTMRTTFGSRSISRTEIDQIPYESLRIIETGLSQTSSS